MSIDRVDFSRNQSDNRRTKNMNRGARLPLPVNICAIGHMTSDLAKQKLPILANLATSICCCLDGCKKNWLKQFVFGKQMGALIKIATVYNIRVN